VYEYPRKIQKGHSMSTGLSNKSPKQAKKLAKKHRMLYDNVINNLAKKHRILNDNEIHTPRLTQRINGLPPVLGTNILRVCRQTYVKGFGIMWKKNAFTVAVLTAKGYHEDTGLSSMFAGIDVARIQHLHLELNSETTTSYSPAGTSRRTSARRQISGLSSSLYTSSRLSTLQRSSARTTKGGVDTSIASGTASSHTNFTSSSLSRPCHSRL
jgi:hypothetical protein